MITKIAFHHIKILLYYPTIVIDIGDTRVSILIDVSIFKENKWAKRCDKKASRLQNTCYCFISTWKDSQNMTSDLYTERFCIPLIRVKRLRASKLERLRSCYNSC